MPCKFTYATVLLTACLVTSPTIAKSKPSSSSNWEGQYIGAAFSPSNERADPTVKAKEQGYFITSDPGQTNPEASTNLVQTGINSSLMWGINRQKGNFIYGLETDISRFDFNQKYNSGNITYITVPAATFSISTEVSSNWGASLRPRLGYIHEDSLYFASAGPSLKRFKYNFNFSDTNGPDSTSLSTNKIALGVTAGFGTERKLDENWSLRAEYLYSFYNNIIDKDTTLATNSPDGFTHKLDHEMHSLRIGLIKAF